MDKLESYLSRLPQEPPRDDLPLRICQAVRRRSARRRRAHALFGTLFTAGGLYFLVPAFLGWVGAIPMPDSGAGWLAQVLSSLLVDFPAWLFSALGGLLAYPQRFAAPVGVTAVLGMLLLSVGVLIAFAQLLPWRFQ